MFQEQTAKIYHSYIKKIQRYSKIIKSMYEKNKNTLDMVPNGVLVINTEN